MPLDGDLEALAQKALDLDSVAPLIEHDPSECETCAEYQKEYFAFAREVLPKIAKGYIDLMRASLEAFENAKIRGHLLADLEEDNARLQKELTAREQEVEELMQQQPVKRKWFG